MAQRNTRAGSEAKATQPPAVVLPESRLLLTVEEAADLLAVGRTTMFSLISEGRVASVRIGRLRRVTRAALVAYIDQLAS